MFLEYSFHLKYEPLQLFLKKLRGTTYAQLINFQDTIHRGDFEIYEIIFNVAQKPEVNQYI